MESHLVGDWLTAASSGVLKSLRCAYKAYWENCHVLLGTKSFQPLGHITIKVYQPFSLQDQFGIWYEKSDFCLFRDIDGFSEEQKKKWVRLLLLPSKVEINDEIEAKMAKRARREYPLDGTEGPSREFFSQVWRQLGGLKVHQGETVVWLFDADFEAGCIPTSDACIEAKLERLPENARFALERKLKVYYRAVGRLMIHWIATDRDISFEKVDAIAGVACGHTIAQTAMPALFRNVLLRGIDPMDPVYPLRDLKMDVLQLVDRQSRCKDENEKYLLLKLVFDLSGDATDESILRETAHNWWVEGRSVAIRALKEGLTLDGFVNLEPIFKLAPLGAINEIIFSKTDISAEHVIAAIAVKGSTCYVPEHFGYRSILVDELKDLLRKRSSNDSNLQKPFRSNFHGSFLNFCTGLWTIPGAYHGDFKICVEFDERLNEMSLPIAFASENTIVFPGCAYHGSQETLIEKLDKSISMTLGQFSMW